ncbi:hypothetical protein PSTT_03175, partial [Puccinia striiformis]
YIIFYCCKFNFGSPDIQCETSKNRKGRQTWAAMIHVGGRKIGLGHDVNKKDSVNEAYLDNVVYLVQCDSNLWVEFLASPENQEAAAGGHYLEEMNHDLCQLSLPTACGGWVWEDPKV